MRVLLALALSLFCQFAFAQQLKVVQIYSDDELLSLIKKNAHLSRVVLDKCQLVEDIQARAEKTKKPAWQFLWGDMLAYGVCVEKDIDLGVHYMKQSANQGLPEGLEQLGRYYHVGKFMQVDTNRAIVYLREAAALGNLNAQLRLGDIFLDGHGSPLDYPELYRQLHHSLTDDKQTHRRIKSILTGLEQLMPERVVKQAKKPY
jgi:hypothetical protein